ncbi:unnamed protein product [Ilex paraguariensis]|uniref:Fe2OG dioxygenase domain-containing protein n=1 Tax=Ilex paraguariensis TaxID=185542 RepID=A0ABC8SXI4_9AQUA
MEVQVERVQDIASMPLSSETIPSSSGQRTNNRGTRRATGRISRSREVNEEYAKYLRRVVEKLLRSLSLVSVPSEDKNYYPPCPRPDLALGVVAHTDMSAISILVPNDVQGLQVFKEGHWYDVKYIPNALIIHIGEQAERSIDHGFGGFRGGFRFVP